MFQRKPRRFRRHSNNNNQMLRGGSNMQTKQRFHTFSKDHNRNNFRTSLSAEKLLEKYISLSKEATSSGDKTLSENYLQHADHFIRVIEDKNRNRNQNKINVLVKPTEDNKDLSIDGATNQDDKVKN